MSDTSTIPAPVFLMGVPIVPFESYVQASQCVEDLVESGRRSFCVAVNPEKVFRAMRDGHLREILRRADVTICDGVGTALAARLLDGRRLRRCTGADLFEELIALAARKGWTVYLLGASAESNEKACANLCSRYPGLRIAGRRDGYFEDAAAVVREINASRADLLFVGMGSPKQELWIAEHRAVLHAAFCMGIGGTLDVVSGNARRAPAFFRRTGTEFVYRLLANPTWDVRVRCRRGLTLLRFVLAVLRQKLFGPSGPPREPQAV